MIYNEEFETLPREALKALQSKESSGSCNGFITPSVFIKSRWMLPKYRRMTFVPLMI